MKEMLSRGKKVVFMLFSFKFFTMISNREIIQIIKTFQNAKNPVIGVRIGENKCTQGIEKGVTC